MKFWLALVLLNVSVIAQQKQPPTLEDVPADRLEDTYAVYDAALPGANVGLQDDAPTYFISDRTDQTYGLDKPEKCILAPDSESQRLQEAAADFTSQQKTRYQLRYFFNLPMRHVRLVSPAEEKQIVDNLIRGSRTGNRQLADATNIIGLSAVGLSQDRALAILVVSNYCGTLCGGARWRVFERTGTIWSERDWSGCSTIARLEFTSPERWSAAILKKALPAATQQNFTAGVSRRRPWLLRLGLSDPDLGPLDVGPSDLGPAVSVSLKTSRPART